MDKASENRRKERETEEKGTKKRGEGEQRHLAGVRSHKGPSVHPVPSHTHTRYIKHSSSVSTDLLPRPLCQIQGLEFSSSLPVWPLILPSCRVFICVHQDDGDKLLVA